VKGRIWKQRVQALKDVTDVQCADGNWNCDAYMHGMANGLILAKAIMTDENPEFLEAPEKWVTSLTEMKRVCKGHAAAVRKGPDRV
jgi:hypothetical protein